MAIHKLIFRHALQKLIHRLNKTRQYYIDIRGSASEQKITSNSDFRDFFETADVIYNFLDRSDFVEQFETDVEFCECFIGLNLDLVNYQKEIRLKAKVDKLVRRFLDGM